MVIHYLFGIIDILAGISLFAAALGYPLGTLQAAMALGLIGKGAFTIKDLLSIVDVILGIIMFVLIWVSAPTLAIVIGVYLCVKGMATFA